MIYPEYTRFSNRIFYWIGIKRYETPSIYNKQSRYRSKQSDINFLFLSLQKLFHNFYLKRFRVSSFYVIKKSCYTLLNRNCLIILPEWITVLFSFIFCLFFLFVLLFLHFYGLLEKLYYEQLQTVVIIESF